MPLNALNRLMGLRKLINLASFLIGPNDYKQTSSVTAAATGLALPIGWQYLTARIHGQEKAVQVADLGALGTRPLTPSQLGNCT